MNVRFAAGLALLAVIGYFAASLLTGEQGLPVYLKAERETQMHKAEAERLRAQVEALRRDIVLLSDPAADPSLVEERARVLYNYGYPDEIYVPVERFDRDERPWRR